MYSTFTFSFFSNLQPPLPISFHSHLIPYPLPSLPPHASSSPLPPLPPSPPSLRLSLKPAISAEKLTPDPQSHDPPHPTASPPLNTPATTGSSPEQPAKPILVPGPYQLDWSKYEIAPRPPPPKLAEYDRSVFREPDPPYPRFATHRYSVSLYHLFREVSGRVQWNL